MAWKFIGPHNDVGWKQDHAINVQLQGYEIRQQGTIGTAPGKLSELRYNSKLLLLTANMKFILIPCMFNVLSDQFAMSILQDHSE